VLFVPLFHCYGQNAILNAGLNAGATILLMRTREPRAIAASIERERATMLFGVPTMFNLLLDVATVSQLRSLRFCFSAAASMPPDIAHRWEAEHALVIHEGYGLTETTPFATYNHDIAHRPGSVGTPIVDVSVAVMDVDDGTFLPPGRTGEVVVRGPNVMLGYWNRPADTAAVIREGWLHTGDIGRIDEDGYVYLVDRLKDMVNVAGLKVWPAEVEAVLHEHRDVVEAAVFGVGDRITGERVVAAVVPRRSTSELAAALLTFCRDRLAAYKVPAEIEIVEDLPKNATGKVLKRLLREEHGHFVDDERTHGGTT